MRKNKFLRTALWLLIATWASGTLLTGTWSKYVAVGEGTAKARFAAFSFEVGSDKPKSGGGWLGSSDISYWEEIVTTGGIKSTVTQSFTIPLFDYNYYGNGYGGSPDPTCAGEKTIVSSKNDIVAAPGFGHVFGHLASNQNSIGGSQAGDIQLQFKNNSEVTVRFKLEYDGAKSNCLGLPIFFRPGTSGTQAAPNSNVDARFWFRTDLVPSSAYRPVVGTNFPASGAHDEWIILQPGTSTTRTVCIVWPHTWGQWAVGTSTNAWGENIGAAPTYAGGTLTLDAYETSLGKKTAADYLDLVFRLTVEQVD